MVVTPGVNLEKTPTLNSGGLSDGNLIRFFAKLVEKLGGWQRLTNQLFVGTARSLFGWGAFDGVPYLAIGTEQRLEIFAGGTLSDITPVIATTNPAVSFSTVLGSSIVTIQDPVVSPGIGDWIQLVNRVSVGGVVLQGFYKVVAIVDGTHYTVDAGTGNLANIAVVGGGVTVNYITTNGSATVTVQLPNHGFAVGDLFKTGLPTTAAGILIDGIYSVVSVLPTVGPPDQFTIIAGTAANASGIFPSNGGNARIQYLLPSGVAVNTPGGGWGSGDWGAFDWGGANDGTNGGPGVPSVIHLRNWSLDHWGEDLIASPCDGKIYTWSPPTIVPAAVLAGAPVINEFVFALAQAQILVACGTETGGVKFPTLIRWCDSGNRTAWVASAINQAGSFQLPSGSRIVAGLTVGLGALIWTDADLWSMVYQGLPFVFGFNRIAVNCEAISVKAPLVVGGSVVWPSDRGFFRYDGGGVSPLDCTVYDFFFDNLDENQTEQVFGALNTLFNEAAWGFPVSTSSPLYDPAIGSMAFVKWNFSENSWDKIYSAQYQRSAWTDHSPVGNPIGADFAGLLQEHERGADADGDPMVWFWRTGDSDLGESGDFARLDRIAPDFVTKLEGGATTVQTRITVLGRDFANQPYSHYGPFTVTSESPMINCNIRNRQIALEVGGSDRGTSERLGAFNLRIASAGRR
jgi:hypothetical protein